METRVNFNMLLLVSLILLVMVSTTSAGPLLFPMHVGLRHTYKETIIGTGSIRYIVGELTEKQRLNSMDYYLIESWELDSGDPPEPVDLVRSTEDAVYSYNSDTPGSDDYLQFQKARVGTTWTFYQPHISGKNYKVIEIVAIERVTVPYGTFKKAYKHRRHRCETPEGANPSPYWYEWIVPGVGVVKKVDYWGEPEIEELVSISSTLQDIMANTLNYFYQSVTNGDLVGVGKGKGKKQLNSLKKMLKTADELIEDGYISEACEQLIEAHSRCDGDTDPPDYVTGTATASLANMIQVVIDGLGCE